MRTGLCAILAAALAQMSTASAQANKPACWTNDAVKAAQVRELHVLLMTVSLRCRAINPGISASYDQFLVRQKQSIADAETKLKVHFGFSRTTEGRTRFERFHTSLANFYGVGKTDTNSCAMFDLVTRELGKNEANAATMTKFAEDIVPNPQLDAPHCAALSAKNPS